MRSRRQTSSARQTENDANVSAATGRALAFEGRDAYGPDMIRPITVLALAAVASAFALSAAAFAADDKGALPGVEANHGIVRPAAEPEEKIEAQSPYGPGFVKVGDSWVKISGRIRYDVDVSTQKPARRKPGQ